MNGCTLTGLTCSKAPGFWMVEHQLVNFLIILVCLLFIHASIHNNLSAGAQNVTGAYVANYACLQALVNNALT